MFYELFFWKVCSGKAVLYINSETARKFFQTALLERKIFLTFLRSEGGIKLFLLTLNIKFLQSWEDINQSGEKLNLEKKFFTAYPKKHDLECYFMKGLIFF